MAAIPLYGADYVIFDPIDDPDVSHPAVRDVEWSFDPIPEASGATPSGRYRQERCAGEVPRFHVTPPPLGKVIATTRGKRLVTPDNPDGWDACSVAYLATKAADKRGFVRVPAVVPAERSIVVDAAPGMDVPAAPRPHRAAGTEEQGSLGLVDP